MAMFVYKSLASFTPGFFSTEPKMIPNFVAENLSPNLNVFFQSQTLQSWHPRTFEENRVHQYHHLGQVFFGYEDGEIQFPWLGSEEVLWKHQKMGKTW